MYLETNLSKVLLCAIISYLVLEINKFEWDVELSEKPLPRWFKNIVKRRQICLKIIFFGYFNNNGASFPTFLKSTNSPNLAVA